MLHTDNILVEHEQALKKIQELEAELFEMKEHIEIYQHLARTFEKDCSMARTELQSSKNELTSVKKQRDELLIALTDVHKATARGDCHGSPSNTAACIIAAFVSLRMDLAETEREYERFTLGAL